MRVLTQGGGFKRFLFRRKDFKLEEKIDNGVRKVQISLTYPLEDGRVLCQDLLEYEGDYYRVKEAPIKGVTGSIVAEQDTDALSGKVFKSYEINASLTNAVKLALNETGWTYKNVSCSDTAIRNMSENNTTALDVLGKIAESYFCEISFSAKEKTVYLYDKIKKAKGYTPKFIRGLNLKSLEVKIDTNDFFTGILPIGADDLTIEDVNDGSKYLYNFQYSSIKKVLIWEDTNYTDAQSLKDAAELKLAEISTPTVTYTASILDLANIDDKYNGYAFDLGDEAVVQDPDIEVSDCQRILKITRYPDKPEKNTIELSSRKTSFSDLQKKILAAVDSVTNVTNGKIVIGSKVEGISANQIDGLEIYYNEPISNLEIDEICK